ncbi:MAG: thymidine phosphorylase, partial [candidate division WOR-3 bacterium]
MSLIVGPLVAACGAVVPMMSGRSLGNTGGTLDKLESIPGFRTDLTLDAFYRNLEQVGVCIVGQSEELCPADRLMYALRDVTATVDSVPLIAASIMSKKLAEGADALVLDVKVGSGAFMARPAQARRLARLMIGIGAAAGRRVSALITAMWEPLGWSVGNALEVVEAIEALKGNWSADLKEVSLALAQEMLLLCGRARSRAQAARLLMRALTQRTALTKFAEMVAAQGGNPGVVDDYALLPQARFKFNVYASASGYVRSIEASRVGRLGVDIGVGRKGPRAGVDHAAG